MISLPIIISLFGLIVILMISAVYIIRLPIVATKKRAEKRSDKYAKAMLEIKKYPIFAPVMLVSLSLLIFIIMAVYVSRHTNFIISILWLVGVVFGLILCLSLTSILKKLIEPILFLYLKLVKAIYPKLQPVLKIYRKLYKPANSSQFYNKNDLVKFLVRQPLDSDSNLTKSDINSLVSLLSFDKKLVKDFYTPRRVVRFVSEDEMISPILMDELHKSGFSRFPVYRDDQDNIVGTLYLRDLIGKKLSGRVAIISSDEVYEVSEEANLKTTLSQFLKSHHHLFIVKNNSNEVLGVISIEDVVEQLIGQNIIDES